MSLPDDPREITPAYVVARLEEAGATLMALPSNAPRLGQRVQTYGYEPELLAAAKAAGSERGVARLPVPDGATIDRMDEAYAWLPIIGVTVTRRIVAARSLTEPHHGDPVFSWARIAAMVGADYRAVQRWHTAGVEAIVGALTFRSNFDARIMVGRYERRSGGYRAVQS